MRARIGEDIALSLKAQAERGGDNGVAHDRHVMQRVVEAERKADDEERRADGDLIAKVVDVAGRERAVNDRCRQRGALDLDRCDVDLAARVDPLPPDGFAVPVERNRKHRRHRDVVRVGVQLNLDAIGKMTARLVDHDVTARHQKQARIALEKEAARVR